MALIATTAPIGSQALLVTESRGPLPISVQAEPSPVTVSGFGIWQSASLGNTTAARFMIPLDSGAAVSAVELGFPMAFPGRVTRLRARLNPIATNLTLTLRIDGVDQAITGIIIAGLADFTVAGNVSFVDGSRLAIKTQTVAADATVSQLRVGLEISTP